MTTTELAETINAGEPPVLLDVRWRLGGPPGIDEYNKGHLPGAVFLDLDTDLAAPPGPAGRHPLPDPAGLQVALRRAGVTAGRPVVAYDAADGSVAARAWWLLRWAGHTEVAVLDGGYAAWTAEDRPTTVDVSAPEAGDFTVRPGQLPVLDADQAGELADSGLLLDARAPERFRGDLEPVDPRAGHVPGARNAPFAAHTQNGRWRSPEELAARFRELGVTADEPVGVYCGSGVTASSVVLALEVAGFAPPALYAGSWSNWSADPERPVATGD